MSDRFEFPKNIEPFEVVLSHDDLKTRIQQQIHQSQFESSLLYRFKIKQNLGNPKAKRRLIAACTGCKCRMRYEKDGDKYKLVMYSTSHKHNPLKKVQIKKIEEKVKQLGQDGIELSRSNFMQRYDCSKNDYEKAKKSAEGAEEDTNFSNLTAQKINQIHIPPEVESSQEFKFPEQIIFPSQMKKQYLKYGKCLYFHTNKLPIKAREINLAEKKLLIATFCGFNGYRKIVVFGCGLILDQSEDSLTHYRILKAFLQKIETPIPTQTIITIGDERTTSAIARLNSQGKYEFEHLIDPYLYQKQVTLLGRGKQLIASLIEARTKQEYVLFLKQLKSITNIQQMGEIEKLEQKSKLLCFSQLPNTFVHGPSLSPCEKLNNLVKNCLKSAKNSPQVSKSLRKVFSKVNAESYKAEKYDVPIEDRGGFYFLKNCRKNLSSDILKEILNQVIRNFQNWVHKDTSGLGYSYRVNKIGDQKMYNVFYGEGKLRCDCGYHQKTQLPCDHLISVSFVEGIDLYEMVGDFYKVAQE